MGRTGWLALVLALSGSMVAGCGGEVAPMVRAEAPVARAAEVVDGGVVLDGELLATATQIEGVAVDAQLRPGTHDTDTVLILARVDAGLSDGRDDGFADRYELSYVVAGADGVSEVFWFPWRLQVAEEARTLLDVAPLPVWAPDGEAVAWIEWVEDGTRLRTVGWIDDGTVRNPSDDADAYALREVPAGVQLEAWQRETDGSEVLLGRQRTGAGEQPYRIRLRQDRSVTTVRMG